jgi:hypothetical protein
MEMSKHFDISKLLKKLKLNNGKFIERKWNKICHPNFRTFHSSFRFSEWKKGVGGRYMGMGYGNDLNWL